MRFIASPYLFAIAKATGHDVSRPTEAISIAGDKHVGEGGFGSIEVDQHADGASFKGVILEGADVFSVDGEGE